MPFLAQQFAVCVCWECGVQFAVHEAWLIEKMNREESIQCPNGHEYACEASTPEIDLEKHNKDLRAENERLRREVVQALHNAEQAEARGTLPANAEVTPEPVTVRIDDEWIYCPCCNASFRLIAGLVRHVTRKHAGVVDPEAVRLAAGEATTRRLKQWTNSKL